MQKNILIIGSSSFVASGLFEEMTQNSFEVDCFTRGQEKRDGNQVFGNVFNLGENEFLKKTYDVIINFIVIKDADASKNLEFIKGLVSFCETVNAKQLIHFSSIMVYDYAEIKVDETTAVEPSSSTYKKGYGEIKIAVDEYLNSVRKECLFEIVLVRSGYVLDASRACPFVKQLPMGVNLIKGNKQSKQPIVKKVSIHQALLKIINIEVNLPVYHFFPNNNQTKYQFAKEKFGGIILFMPEFLFKTIPLLFVKMGLFPKPLYSRFEGMYIKTIFSSKSTEDKLKIKF